MSKDEEFVRSVWKDCGSAGPVQFAEHWQVWCGAHFFDSQNEDSAWTAAAEFTRHHLEQVRQVDAEIMWLEEEKELCYSHFNYPVVDRILTREQAALAELRRGMK